jgi:adenylate cyclase
LISKYSIAVLPFVNMSSDRENEYFSDGITEEILNTLSKIDGLHVTARTSSFAFKNRSVDVREIGKNLNVAFLLEGSIRKADGIVRITAQLTRTDNGFHIWSDSWDRELKNIFILQDEIAALISEQVNKNLEPEHSVTDYIIENTDALDAYLRANYLLNKWDFSQGLLIIELFEKAINLDPGFIKAYVGLCNVYTWLGSTGHIEPREAFIKVEHSISKVLELDPNLPDVYMLMASKNFWIEWDLQNALKNINKALNLKPSYPDALMYKGIFLAASGRVEEALDCLFQADRLDPYANQINSGIGMIYNYINEDEKALEYFEKNIRIAPFWDAQYIYKIESLCKLDHFDEAWDSIQLVEQNPKTPLSVAELKAYYFARKGEKKEAYAQIGIMEDEEKMSPLSGSPNSAFFAQLYLILGENDHALDYLEKGLNEGATPFLFNKINCIWDELREHPRYIAAMKRIKYPEGKAESFVKGKKYSKSNLQIGEAEKYILELEKLMEKQKPWTNPTLNLSDLAELINISSNLLSQLLNEFIGMNFYDYVNTYRLNYFIELIDKSFYKNFTLLSVAYECGFNSKTTFNAFFKKVKGITPSEYFKKI